MTDIVNPHTVPAPDLRPVTLDGQPLVISGPTNVIVEAPPQWRRYIGMTLSALLADNAQWAGESGNASGKPS